MDAKKVSAIVTALDTVCEAARIRQRQWSDASIGRIEPDQALYEADSDECGAIADDLEDALAIVEELSTIVSRFLEATGVT